MKILDKYVAKNFLNLEKKGTVIATDTALTVGFRAEVVNYWKNNAVQQALTTISNRVRARCRFSNCGRMARISRVLY